jgi:hypothetical protein
MQIQSGIKGKKKNGRGVVYLSLYRYPGGVVEKIDVCIGRKRTRGRLIFVVVCEQVLSFFLFFYLSSFLFFWD